jgi:putative selenium metabolism hydrolase
MDYTELWKLVEAYREDLIVFAQKLVQTPSPSGGEGEVAALIEAEMRRLGYDQVWIDEAGNVVGLVRGGDGPSLMFNGHMDHVDAGDPALWSHPPFAAEIHDGVLWGRGAADMKGALAAMVYAVGLVKKLDVTPPGDLYVAAVVQEEVGGLGSRHLAQTLPVARAVIGEASGNELRRGHRGRVELQVRFEGRSVHASMPHLGINPHLSLSRFVAGLRELTMVSDPAYGPSSVAPTRIYSEPDGTNITPAVLHLSLDWRNIPSETVGEIIAKLEGLLARSLEAGCQGRVRVSDRHLTTYTGFQMVYPDTFGSFTTEPGHAWLQAVRSVLASALGHEVAVDTWRFATDGGHFAAAGATVIGFGPGDDRVVHTVEERLSLGELIEAVVGYISLAMAANGT